MEYVRRSTMVIQGLPQLQQPCYSILKTRKSHLLKSGSAIQQINLDNFIKDSTKSEVQLHFTSKNRQTQHLNYIKEKFIKMIQLQNQNFVERNQRQKQRERQIKDEEIKTKMKAKMIKDHINDCLVTSRNWRIKNMHDGALMRSKKLQNQHIIAKRECQDLRMKKTFVNQKLKDNFYYKGKLSQSKTERLYKKELKYDQQYRCGMIYQMRQAKSYYKNSQRSQQDYSSSSYRKGDLLENIVEY